MKKPTRISITITFSLEELKRGYRNHFGYDKSHRVTKKELASWFSTLVEGDIMDNIINDES